MRACCQAIPDLNALHENKSSSTAGRSGINNEEGINV